MSTITSESRPGVEGEPKPIIAPLARFYAYSHDLSYLVIRLTAGGMLLVHGINKLMMTTVSAWAANSLARRPRPAAKATPSKPSKPRRPASSSTSQLPGGELVARSLAYRARESFQTSSAAAGSSSSAKSGGHTARQAGSGTRLRVLETRFGSILSEPAAGPGAPPDT